MDQEYVAKRPQKHFHREAHLDRSPLWCVHTTSLTDLKRFANCTDVCATVCSVAYSMIDKFLNPFTLLAGPALVIFLCARSASNDPINGVYVLPVWNILLSWCVWLTATRTAKLAPHLWNRPADIIYVPVWVAFGYYFSVMKLYALFTLHEVSLSLSLFQGDSAHFLSSSLDPPRLVGARALE